MPPTERFTGWRKATASEPNGNCVEVATVPGVTGVRDSKLGEASPVLPFAVDSWTSFLHEVKNGTFDR
ncbi:DUF397 domain-containing protein [Saccharopolyspora sp. NPDC047091]|uniref:DUF397 domain-containing protein n=1 Tax=Saccharopolyspora sp. NPDC047091 TaxID=3155924 RepID=UPI0033EE33C6